MAAMFYLLATFTQSINPVDPGPAFYPRIVSLLLFVGGTGADCPARGARAGFAPVNPAEPGERGLGARPGTFWGRYS